MQTILSTNVVVHNTTVMGANMHFGDDNAPQGRITVVVYKHEIIDNDGEKREDEFDYDIMSIQSAEYIQAYSLVRLHFSENYVFADALKNDPAERWYQITLLDDGWGRFTVTTVTDVTEHPDETLRLH